MMNLAIPFSSSYDIKKILFIFLSFLMYYPIVLLNQDWAGWITLYLTFAIVFIYGINKNNSTLFFLCLLLLVMAHQIVSIVNAYSLVNIYLPPDSLKYHSQANRIVENGFSPFTNMRFSLLYSHYIALFYHLNNSFFFGQELCLLAFVCCCLVIAEIIELLGVKKYSCFIVLICGVWPSTFMHVSSLLRESWQMLFLCLTIYYGILMVKNIHISSKKTLRYVILLLVFALILGMFHGALFFYAFVLISYFSIAAIFKFFSIKWYNQCIIIASLLLVSLFLMFYWIDLEAIIKKLELYRMGIVKRKGTFFYGFSLPKEFSFGYIAFILKSYVFYLGGPFNVNGLNSLVFFFLSKLRIILLITSLFSLAYIKEQKFIYGSLLFFYFSLTFIFSLAIVNYGTAFRHQLLTDWILVVLGSYCFLTFFQKKITLGTWWSNHKTNTSLRLGRI